MQADFDPYYKWLGIPPEKQPHTSGETAMRRSMRIAAAMIFIGCGVGAVGLAPTTTLAQTPTTLESSKQSAGKAQPPDRATEAEALAKVQQVFEKQYAEAKSREQKLALANLMLSAGKDTREAVPEKYVLLRVARDIFNGEGAIDGSLEAIGELDKSFAIDAQAQQVAAYTAACQATVEAEVRLATLQKLQPFLQTLVEADRFDLACPLADEALKSARKTRDAGTVKFVADGKATIDDLAKEHEAVRAMFAKLDTEPTHPEANLAVGSYYVMAKQNWERGIPYLALGSDPALKSLAVEELRTPAETLKLGDGWWDLAELRTDKEKEAFRRYASKWYLRAWKSADGLNRRKIEQRVTSFESGPLDRTHWKPYTWKGWWNAYDLNRIETGGNDREFMIRNTSGIHTHIQIRHAESFEGDFYLEAELMGVKVEFGLAENTSKDRTAYVGLPDSTKWQKVIIQRAGSELNVTVDGAPKEVSYFNCSSSLTGQFTLKIHNEEAIGVRKLVILE